MSSATDPYQPLERHWRLTRACLDVFPRYPPALLNVQTRSPLAQDDYPRLHELGERCWLNFTLETNLESARSRTRLLPARFPARVTALHRPARPA